MLLSSFHLTQIYEKYQEMYTVEPNNARQLVEIAARDIEKLLSNRSKALVVSSACALSLSAIPVDCVLFKVLAGLEHFIWFTSFFS